jgi:outer membrane protein insertion porin family
VAGGVLAARPSRAQEELLGELKTVSKVQFEGVHHIAHGTLRRQIKTQGPSFWPWHSKPTLRMDFIRSDTLAIAAFYRHYGYLDASVNVRVATTEKANEVAVTFVVEEGSEYRIRDVALEGISSYPPDQLRRKLWARTGKPFDPSYLQLDTLRISQLYQDRGFRPHVRASFHLATDSVSVRYEVSEGPLYHVGDVYLFSQSTTSAVNERLVRRELILKKGDVYRSSRVQRSVERLYETGLFSQVQVTPLPDSSNTLMEFQIGYRERKPRWLDAGIGSGTTERFRFTGEWGHRNILGKGLQGALSSRVSFDGTPAFQLWHTEATLLEPWLFQSRTRGSVTPFYEIVDDRTDPRWVVRQDAVGVNFQLQRELGRFSRILLTQGNVWAHQDLKIDPRIAAFLPDSTVDSVEASIVSKYATHRIGLGAERDLRDNPLDGTRGSAQALNVEVAGGPFRGKSSFRKLQFASGWYTPFRTTWVLATRIRAGFSQPFGPTAQFSPGEIVDPEVGRLPLEDRFRTGGVNTIRGFNENTIPPSGGLALLQGNIELRIPLIGPFGLEAYVDAGNVWSRPSFMKWDQFVPRITSELAGPNDVRYVFGLGPRLKLPIGPLRVDFTWTLRPTPGGPGYGRVATQFAIGPSF